MVNLRAKFEVSSFALLFQSSDNLLRFQTRAAQSWVIREWFWKPRQILHILTPRWKLGKGEGDLYTNCWSFTYDRTSEIHLVAIHCLAAEDGGLIKRKKL